MNIEQLKKDHQHWMIRKAKPDQLWTIFHQTKIKPLIEQLRTNRSTKRTIIKQFFDVTVVLEEKDIVVAPFADLYEAKVISLSELSSLPYKKIDATDNILNEPLYYLERNTEGSGVVIRELTKTELMKTLQLFTQRLTKEKEAAYQERLRNWLLE